MAIAKPMETTELSEQSVAWLRSRSVSAETAAIFNVKSVRFWTHGMGRETDCVAFPYTNKGRVYAAKIRSTEGKAFASNGAPQTLFGADNVDDWSEVLICEGEMDVLACREAGVLNAVSIPGGATSRPANPTSEDNSKFAFIRHAEDNLKGCKKIIIATDDDDPGKYTGEEIARRIGKDRCWKVDWPEGCKDANDVLMKLGPKALRDCINDAKPWPIIGLYGAKTYMDRVQEIFHKGLRGGEGTGYQNLDEYYTITPGLLSVVTGHPSSGKSEFVDQLMVNLARSKGWNFAVCSFENPPELHIAKLAQKFVGKPFFSGLYPRMTEAELKVGTDLVDQHFSFIHQSDGSLSTLDSIIERLHVAVMRYGIRGAVIDPYNYITKGKDASETDWISEMLSRIRAFAAAHDVHVWFVAHPTKMMRSADGEVPPPFGYDISGSAAWFAKADMGVTVHRPDRGSGSRRTEVYVWKARFSWTGKEGKTDLVYRVETASYVETSP